jgi:D-3-phosphoglycerate dehydrogenase
MVNQRMTWHILVADAISDHGLQQLTDAPDVHVDKAIGLTEDELVARIGAYDALLVRSQTKVTARIMDAAPKLRVIGRAGVGVDNIDLPHATKRGMIVINAPDGNTITTCEHTFAMMMALARHIPQAYRKTIEGTWDRKTFVGVELRNKVLGIIGMGRIGSEVALRAKAFGMRVIGYDPFLSEAAAEKIGVQLGTVADILAHADFMTVHTPLTPETRHMISTNEFSRMKKGMRIVNCARGGIIDEDALVHAVRGGIVAGAAFDVFAHEPPTPDHPFFSCPEIIVTPHLGASTIEAQENVAIDVSEQLLCVLRGTVFRNAVNMPSVAPEVLAKLTPYFSLATKLGSFLAQRTDEPIARIAIHYSGDLGEGDTAPLTRHVVAGVLAHHLGAEHVNVVNALHIARDRALDIVTQQTKATKGFTNVLTVTIETKTHRMSISGTLFNGYGARIVQIDSYPVDVSPDGHLLIIAHQDKPGIIGRVGSLLGQNDVNIAAMQVGRSEVGGSAIMVLSIDKPLPHGVRDALTLLPDLSHVRTISL